MSSNVCVFKNVDFLQQINFISKFSLFFKCIDFKFKYVWDTKKNEKPKTSIQSRKGGVWNTDL